MESDESGRALYAGEAPAPSGPAADDARRALADSERRYRLLAENASDVVVEGSPTGEIRWVSPSVTAMMAWAPEDLVDVRFTDLVHPEDLPAVLAAQEPLDRGEEARFEIRLRTAGGDHRWMNVRVKPVLDEDGVVVSRVAGWWDAEASHLARLAELQYRDALAASERQARKLADAYEAARNDAIEANSAKTAFLSRMSHELRTPLNAVLGFAQLLALDPLTEEQADAVAQIRSGGRHLLDLINEILDISRIEAGQLSLSLEPVEVASVLAEAVDLVRPMAQQHDVALLDVMLDVDGSDGVHVHADRQRVVQVLLNLLSNAVKYNHPGGSVRIECRPGPGAEVRLAVTDTGPGLPDELLPRLFLPFDRLGAESSGVEGTGIGLALADGLARAMGGRIEVSTQLGEGSTFTLLLRRSALASSSESATTPSSRRLPGAGARILYIEDNATNAALMARVTALRPGCELDVAADGAHGIASALHSPPDLVFLDLHLPDMPGEEVLRRLRAVPGCAGIPIVIVTADASSGARERMLGLGSDGFLTKPLDLEAVLGWIDRTTFGRDAR